MVVFTVAVIGAGMCLAAGILGRIWDRWRKHGWLPACKFVASVTLIFLAAQCVVSGASESRCWIWPSIGTRHNPEFTFGKFDQIRIGMTQGEVERIIGLPLERHFMLLDPRGWMESPTRWQSGDETCLYTLDSSRLRGDWAWLSRELVFRNGAVVNIVRQTHFD